MNDSFQLLYDLFDTYGFLIVFPLMIMENIPFLGFAVPGIAVLIVLGFIYAANMPVFLLTMLLALLGVIISDTVMFMLGRTSLGKWKSLKNVNSRTHKILKIIRKQPTFMLLFYQFPPYFRMFLPFSLGVAKYSWHQWMIVNVLGSIVFVCTIGGVSYMISTYFRSVVSPEELSTYVSVVIGVYALLYFIRLIVQYKSSFNKE